MWVFRAGFGLASSRRELCVWSRGVATEGFPGDETSHANHESDNAFLMHVIGSSFDTMALLSFYYGKTHIKKEQSHSLFHVPKTLEQISLT